MKREVIYKCPIPPSKQVVIPAPKLQPDGSMTGQDLVESYFFALEALQMCNVQADAQNKKIQAINEIEKN